jgi:diguanylate cyclase (GGDEF)-like protein
LSTTPSRGEPGHGLVERAARIAGLSSFEPPSLEAVERRRIQLWGIASVLLLTVGSGLALSTSGAAILPRWLSPTVVQYGLLGLIALFCAYAIEKELHLRRLAHLLIEERVLTAALTNRLREISSLLAAGKAINLGLDLDQVLTTIVDCSLELLDGRDGSIMLASGGRELRTVSTGGHSAAKGARVAFGEGVAGRVAASREPLLISGKIAHLAPAQRVSEPPAPTSAMSVPLLHRGALLGVLNVNARDGRDYTEHDLRALSLFGEQAAAAIANAQLYQAQRLMASQKLFQALHDGLTRLPNRALFLERVERALSRQRREDQRIALLLMDLDDFKRINDSLGHAAGDEVLSAFAERIRTSVRAGDTVARIGGDEFALLVEDLRSVDETVQAARRLQVLLASPFLVGDRELRLSGSVGIAVEEPGVTSREDLLRNADTALHAAQEQGKGEVVVFERAMHTRALRRFHLEAELRHALESEQLEVHYQPICDMTDGSPRGVEALVRWRHPERGLLPAGAFVPFAEHAGILDDIDRWVLRQACRVARDLLASPRPGEALWVNVNLSPSRLRDSDVVGEVARAIEEFELPPGQLTLEITEGAVLSDAERAGQVLAQLKDLGVRLALDDFGTGYSSLSYVRRFPVDAVKIDRVFVDGVARDAGTNALVQAIVKLGQGLSLDVIAEGIERRSQIDSLLAIDCALGQGWLLAKPMPEAALLEYLGARNRSRQIG